MIQLKHFHIQILHLPPVFTFWLVFKRIKNSNSEVPLVNLVLTCHILYLRFHESIIQIQGLEQTKENIDERIFRDTKIQIATSYWVDIFLYSYTKINHPSRWSIGFSWIILSITTYLLLLNGEKFTSQGENMKKPCRISLICSCNAHSAYWCTLHNTPIGKQSILKNVAQMI